MYLHEDKEEFKDIILAVADNTGLAPKVIEKDYYITLILRLLSEKAEHCVFKGGTSLSKGYHVIERFSEDIDITFDEHIGENRRKKLKNVILKGISEEIGVPIANWEFLQSDRDLNAYNFSYDSMFGEDDRLYKGVKLEMALGSYAFPTRKVKIGNYVGDYLETQGEEKLACALKLERFEMSVQAIERTFVDKVFALCDYYLQGKSERYSRHLYDIYKLTPLINFDENFRKLIVETRSHRATMKQCPSAKESANIEEITLEYCEKDFYKEDYNNLTSYFATDYVDYEKTIENMRKIMQSDSILTEEQIETKK